MSGRPPKPAKMRIFDGTHRDDRHGPKELILCPEGDPVKSAQVIQNPVANQFWDTYVPQAVKMGIATAYDSATLEDLCLSYALMDQARMSVQIQPLDKEARIAFSAYLKAWEGMAKEFGMTPVARERIKAGCPSFDELEAKYG